MTAKIQFLPVDNGDMTLIQTESGRNILIDMNIRSPADDRNDFIPDVCTMLRNILPRDTTGRQYVDVLVLSHPDKDHCLGLQKHFHLGLPEDWSPKEDKIFIREIWSSPMVYRRASRNLTLCDDAKAFNTEAKRRVKEFKQSRKLVDGNKILILGEDENGKTDDLQEILVKAGELVTKICGQFDSTISPRLLAPLPTDPKDEESFSKNKSSIILQFSITGGGELDKCFFLTGGDAEVEIWERIRKIYQNQMDYLKYDILLAPHHCSWRSLSHDSWSECREKSKLSEDAIAALSNSRDGATIVASSKPIDAKDDDPPCIGAKRVYENILEKVKGKFVCVCENLSTNQPEPLVIEIDTNGPRIKSILLGTTTSAGVGGISNEVRAHGKQ